jgi:hypothetical protein
MLRRLGLALILCLPALAQTSTTGNTAANTPGADPARDFFRRGEVLRIALSLEPAAAASLRERPREYVQASATIDGKQSWASFGVKLKGAAGSFRQLDERPGFTVHLGKFGGKDRLHGLKRFHLNNGVQDDSRFCEWLGHEIFTAAGRPAPRVAHAHVWLNGRDLGLYVLRESYDTQFLQRVFGSTAGNLYDGGFCQEIDQDLEKDSGDGPDDHSDLRRLHDLCRDFDRERPTRFEQAIDIEALIDFCALEAMLGHWDGYSLNRNNYRLWLPKPPGRAMFLPHGMDQLFGDAEASILRHPPAIAASALMQHAAWRKRYRQRLEQLLPLFQPDRLLPKLRPLAQKLQRELASTDRNAAAEYEAAVQDLIQRLEARYQNLKEQVKAPEPKPLAFPGNRPVAQKTWHPAAETDHLDLQKRAYQGVTSLWIGSRERGQEPLRGSFRTTVLLAKGRYRLLATARCEGVEGPAATEDGPSGGVRLAVGDARSERLFGNQGWTALRCEFDVGAFQEDIELRLEFVAHRGKAWFRSDSLLLERLPD